VTSKIRKYERGGWGAGGGGCRVCCVPLYREKVRERERERKSTQANRGDGEEEDANRRTMCERK